jgi:hypothetical protein
MPTPTKTPAAQTREELLDAVRDLYESHGLVALSTPFLEQKRLYARLLKVGLYQPALLQEMNLAEEYAAWRESSRTYRGVSRPRWTWDMAVAKAAEIKEQQGDLPPLDWFRRNGRTSVVNTVFRTGHTWEQLRKSVGCFATSSFRESRSGIRWRSYGEASLSDFLHARGIPHKRGERYKSGYEKSSGRRSGHYDMHFQTTSGAWVDVEIWGDLNDVSGGQYARVRKGKEEWNEDRADFLGIEYKDCLSDDRLTEILARYIGIVEPFRFEKSHDPFIETSHWTDSDELLETCRRFAATMPDGIFPGESWLRKRGKHAERPGPTYNTLAVRVHQWLGGTRNVRRFLGHGEASTIDWSPETAILAWQDFQARYGLSPTQLASRGRKNDFPPDVVKRAQAIRQACVRHGALNDARNGKTARKIVWTNDTTVAAWRNFELRHGFAPSSKLRKMHRDALSKLERSEAARIYGAAVKLKLLTIIRRSDPHA